MAIVSRFSVENVQQKSPAGYSPEHFSSQAASVKKAMKRGLTQRLRERVMGDSDSSDEEKDNISKT